MIRNAFLISIYIVAISCWAQAPQVIAPPLGTGATGAPLRIAPVPGNGLTAPISPLTGTMGTALPPPGYCPQGWLPQYCGISWGGQCTSMTPIYQCIQQGQTIGQFARYNCVVGDYNCMATQQYWASRCPPGMMQNYCVQQYYNYYQQQQRTRIVEAAALGAILGGSVGAATSLFGGKNGSARDAITRGGSAGASGRSEFSFGPTGSGSLDPCGTLSPNIKHALQQAVDFRNGCRLANTGVKQKMVINDYSPKGDQPAVMYVFNADGTKCIGKTSVSFGTNGEGTQPIACADGGSNVTPPGFHLTCKHYKCPDCSYDEFNSTGLCGLEDQATYARGVLIHYGSTPGNNSSNGCSGVKCYPEVRSLLGYGSLVYNYFGDRPKLSSGCRSRTGLPDSPIRQNPSTCDRDRDAPSFPGVADGESTDRGEPTDLGKSTTAPEPSTTDAK